MSIDAQIVDGTTSSRTAKVDADHALCTQQLPYPPLAEQKVHIWSQYFTDDGLSTGTSDLQIAAVAAPKEFWIPAVESEDIWITHVSFVIGDAQANLNEFGNITALTNGVEWYYTRASGEKITIEAAMQTNWDFVRACKLNPAYGTGTAAFRATNVEGGAEAYAPVFDFLAQMPPAGLLLARGTNNKIVLNIQDQTDQVDVFNAKAYGYQRFE